MSLTLPAPAISGSPVSLGGRINIFPGSPWPALNTAAGSAYAAQLPNDNTPEPALYALVGTADLPPRGEALTPLRAFQHQNLIRFVDYGVVDWPGHGTTSVYIFAVPPGPSLAHYYATQQKPLDDEHLGQRLKPLLAMVRSFGSTNLSHGNLSPGNLFIGPTGIVAGECISAPPSFSTGSYLTIERQQADPTARGIPTPADDMYAIGTLVTIIGLGINPVGDVPLDKLLSNKIDYGSYNALLGTSENSSAGGERLRGATAELARGLLEDSPARRWTMDEVEAWLAGRHPTPRPANSERSASRPFLLDGVSGRGTTTRRATAHLLATNMAAAIIAVASGDLQKWVQRTLDDSELASALETDLAQQRRSDNTPSSSMVTATPQQVSRAILLLDSSGPVRYRDSCVLPSGYGAWLSTRMQQNGDLQVPAELLASGLLTRWLQEQMDSRADHIRIEQQLESSRSHLDRKQIGYGIERVLYELMPAQYCLSPLVRGARAATVNAVLIALEKAAGNMGGNEPIDRHIAAFLVARDKRLTAGLLVSLLPTSEPSKRAIGILTLLSEAQYRHGPASLPNLARWLTRQLEPAIQRYHRPATQKRLRGQLEQESNSGILANLVQLVDDPDTIDNDSDAYEAAKQNWQRAEREIEELQGDIERRALIEQNVGQPVASGIAVFLGLIAMAMVVVLSLRGSFL